MSSKKRSLSPMSNILDTEDGSWHQNPFEGDFDYVSKNTALGNEMGTTSSSLMQSLIATATDAHFLPSNFKLVKSQVFFRKEHENDCKGAAHLVGRK